MKTIAIKAAFSWDEPISVKVDEVCDHAGAIETYGEAPVGLDDSKTMPMLECRCGAYQWGYQAEDEDGVYTDYDGEWHT